MTDATVRIIGAVLLIGGIYLGYAYGYLPLEAARNHAASVDLSLKLTFVVPAFILFGGFTAALDRRGRQWLQIETGSVRKLRPAGWVFAAICIGAGIGLHEWLETAIGALGYR
jgi:uncharacterized membrane protein